MVSRLILSLSRRMILPRPKWTSAGGEWFVPVGRTYDLCFLWHWYDGAKLDMAVTYAVRD